MSLNQPARILIVDDQAVTRSLVRRMLERAGYEVLQADSGEQAVALAETQPLDAVILDLEMPRMGGLETCRRLRAMDAHQVTPILVMTALAEQEHLSGAFAAGCDDFIAKPVTALVLEARLKNHLRHARLYDELQQVRRSLNRYVSPRTQLVAERFSRSGEPPPPERVDVCVLFSDIRGFTRLSQSVDPEYLFGMLSRHLGAQVELVYRHGGYVDKYAGDGVMAIFEGNGMALRACQCAREIIEGARRADLQERMFAVGCGVHRGPAVVGNIGSPEHLDYSVIGESVNLAARLCGHAGPMSAIVSEALCSSVPQQAGMQFSNRRQVKIKGFEQPVTVYELR